jgi:ADP-heptose:LPS heptosyltransferase
MTLSNWARFKSAAYLIGNGIHFGLTGDPILPKAAKNLGVYCIGVNPSRNAPCDICSEDLGFAAPDSQRYIFLDKTLEIIPNPKALIQEASTKLKIGGHLIVMVPINNPQEMVTNKFNPDGVDSLVTSAGSWVCKDRSVLDDHLFHIYKLVDRKKGRMTNHKVPSGPRACVVRYGAFGDMIIMSPLVRLLKEKGYHVTVNCQAYSSTILHNNPNVDNLLVQEREAIPNPDLGPYWDLWKDEYDLYINLSESIEGKCLAVEGRPEFYSPQNFRAWRGNHNYYEYALELAGFPNEVAKPKGELFFSPGEKSFAKSFRKNWEGKFLILWSLSGSSYHKVYGLFEPVMTDWLNRHPDALMITTGDEMARLLEFDHPQVIKTAATLPIRQVMALTEVVDVVVGPETGILNAAGCFSTPKVIFMSHSAPDNLCKHWDNAYPLTPNTEYAPCYPCHQLHYNRDTCPLADIRNDQTGEIIASGPRCAMGAVEGSRVGAILDEIYNRSKNP